MAVMTAPIQTERVSKSRISTVDFSNLGFGTYISDHMVVVDYKNGEWQEPKIVPYGEMMMSPAILALHYGQSVFEGMKAFKNKDGQVTIFRPQRHHQRFNKSLERMCMPAIGEELFTNSLAALIELDEAWIPTSEGASLYIRPFMYASEARLGVKISDEYRFVIMTCPVAPYFTKPVKIKVEEEFVRAAEGGTGFAKCAGNYGGAFYPTMLAQKQGFDQVFWTDAKEHKYIEESGAMNVMFVIDGKLVTPKLVSSLLDGVTRDSILTLASSLGIETDIRRISVAELEEGLKKGTLTEAFGVGTAAVVSPIASISIHGQNYTVPVAGPESFQLRAKKKLNDIRLGSAPDVHGWNFVVK